MQASIDSVFLRCLCSRDSWGTGALDLVEDVREAECVRGAVLVYDRDWHCHHLGWECQRVCLVWAEVRLGAIAGHG